MPNDSSCRGGKPHNFRVRTVTGFVELNANDFLEEKGGRLHAKISSAALGLKGVESELKSKNYEVQTLRIATNCFSQWIMEHMWREQVKILHEILESLEIHFCAIGGSILHLDKIVDIISQFPYFSCSVQLSPTDVKGAISSAEAILQISRLAGICSNGLGNFRFCVAHGSEYIPFFPAARCGDKYGDQTAFAVGLENGRMAHELLSKCNTIENIESIFVDGITKILKIISISCERIAAELGLVFVGVDTSLNPSLEDNGSVAGAMECLKEVPTFGGPGTLAAASKITMALQNISGVKRTGYCGLMLPLCEDSRLVELCDAGLLGISDLLSVSSVCGVGVDTVPIPGTTDAKCLSGLLLDVAGIAARWNKSLTCRVLPVPDKNTSDRSSFDSPYMINSKIMAVGKG